MTPTSRPAPSTPSKSAKATGTAAATAGVVGRLIRRGVRVGDVTIGLGVVAARPVVRAAVAAAEGAESAGGGAVNVALGALPDGGAAVRDTVNELSDTGQQARRSATEGLVREAVARAMSNDIAQATMTSVVDEIVEEVVSAAMPSLVERLGSEFGLARIDATVRASVERILPQELERSLGDAVLKAATAPARTARGLVKIPESVQPPKPKPKAAADAAAPAPSRKPKPRVPGAAKPRVPGTTSPRTGAKSDD